MLSYISLTEAIEPLRQIEQARHYCCIQSLASTRLAVRCEGKNRLLVLWSSGPLVLVCFASHFPIRTDRHFQIQSVVERP